MDAASGGQPARGESLVRPVVSGVIYAPLKESHSDRIVVGDRVLFLRDGVTCAYVSGAPLEVTFTEQDGRSLADKITPVRQGN